VAERASFLGDPPLTEEAAAQFDADREDDGYVKNVTRLWCWRPDLFSEFATLRNGLMASSQLTDRDWAVLVTATAAERNDSYCSLAWGARLAKLAGDDVAAWIIADAPEPELSERESALAAWARGIVRDPNATTDGHVARLREVGLGEREIFEATVFVAFRLAFSTVNGALGAAPDKQLADAVPPAVRAAVDFGRAPSAQPSRP
jgi:uncharacterized peroxidase-related enzyme